MPLIRTLPPGELNKYRDHLLQLSAEDRRLRFGNCLDDAGIEGFVRSLRPTENHIFVIEDETVGVVGAVQIAMRNGANAEFAFSVDAEHRRRGFAHELAKRAILWARNRRLRSLHLSCLAENRPIRKLAREAGMRIDLGGGEAEARLTLPPPSLLSLAREWHTMPPPFAMRSSSRGSMLRGCVGWPPCEAPPDSPSTRPCDIGLAPQPAKRHIVGGMFESSQRCV
jgi:GNAT superfamily N-acetyltransferase